MTLCACGCGRPTKLARATVPSLGWVKGRSLEWLKGHNRRKVPFPTESPIAKLCECGCGQPTPLAPQTHLQRGWIAGQPLRFLKGHSLRIIPVKPEPVNEYPRTRLSDGRLVKRHRLKAERALGKPLPRGVEVHHVDGTKSMRSALVICQDKAYHRLLHARQRIIRAGGSPDRDKLCSSCKTAKPFGEFGRCTTAIFGLNQNCRECAKRISRERKLRLSA